MSRDYITVDTQGAWRCCSPVITQGMTPLGTVRRGLGNTGALLQITATGLYVQANAGSVRSLDQQAVQKAMGAVKA